MAEGNVGAAQRPVSEETRLIRGVLGGILAGDSLTLPTQGNKTCLEMAKNMAKCYTIVLYPLRQLWNLPTGLWQH